MESSHGYELVGNCSCDEYYFPTPTSKKMKDFCFKVKHRFREAFRAEEDGSVITPHKCQHLVSILIAEIIGTFVLMFLGCLGTELLPGEYEKENSFLIAAVVFGMAVMIAIQIVGHVSDAHINPAVTLCALILGRVRIVVFFIYIIGQFIGGLLGVGMLKAITPDYGWNNTAHYGCCVRCQTIPHYTVQGWEAFLTEFIITGILILVVCGIWDKRNKSDNAAPLKLGFTVMALSLAAGPFTGASMNPVRSFSPALWEMNFKQHWVYWVAPLGASAVVTLCYLFFLAQDFGTLTYVYGRHDLEVEEVVAGIKSAMVHEEEERAEGRAK